MSAEPAPTTVAVLAAERPAIDIARHVHGELSAAGWTCSAPQEIGPGAVFDVTIRARSLVVTLAPHGPGTWVLGIGHSVGPLARLIGMSDAGDRSTVASAVDHALRRTEGIADLRWLTDAAWEVERGDP